MAAPTSEQIFAGGTLVWNPTTTAGSSPWGGTVLGSMLDVFLEPVVRTDPIQAEEYGGELADEVYLSEEWVATAVLTNWDGDALARIYPNVGTGGSGDRIMTYPGGTLARGGRMSSRAGVLMLAPYDQDGIPEAPGFVLHKAIPRLVRTLRFDPGGPLFLFATWTGLRDSSDQVVGIGNHGDISVT